MLANDGRVVSDFIVNALRGDDIAVYGDGMQTRSFCYVDDLIEALVRLIDADDHLTGPINLGNPQEISVRELAEKIIELTGTRSRIVHRPLPEDDPMRRCPNIARAKSSLGWKPNVSLQEGLSRTIVYFEARLQA